MRYSNKDAEVTHLLIIKLKLNDVVLIESLSLRDPESNHLLAVQTGQLLP